MQVMGHLKVYGLHQNALQYCIIKTSGIMTATLLGLGDRLVDAWG